MGITNKDILKTVAIDVPNMKTQLEDIVTDTNIKLIGVDNKKLDKTGIVTMANMGQDVKEAMTGGSVAVVGKNTVLADNIVNEQVNMFHFDKSSRHLSKNLITTFIAGKVVNSAGVIADGNPSLGGMSNYIDVSENENIEFYGYTNDNSQLGGYFDSNKVYIGRITITTTSNAKIFTSVVPKNAKYIAINYLVAEQSNTYLKKILTSTNLPWLSVNTDNLGSKTLNDINKLSDLAVLKNVTTLKDYVALNFIIKDGFYVNPTSGVEVAYNPSTLGSVSDFIPVIEGDKIKYMCYTTVAKANGCLYDKDKNYIGNVISATVNGGYAEMIIPTNCAYVRINFGSAYKPWVIYKYDTSSIQIPMLRLTSENGVAGGKYVGKKYGALGDSITYGFGVTDRNTKAYCQLVKDKLKFGEVVNYGISSTLIAQQDGYPNSFVERYSTMRDDLDVITVFGGTNDWYFGKKFGTKDSIDITEFYGALNVLMKGLSTKYVGKEVIFITPMSSDYNGKNTDNVNPNTNKTMEEYRNAIIERCKYYSVPCIDLYSLCGMDVAHNPSHKTYYSFDGVHPNDIGHVRMAERVVGFLNSI